jgi:hypothetical protein
MHGDAISVEKANPRHAGIRRGVFPVSDQAPAEDATATKETSLYVGTRSRPAGDCGNLATLAAREERAAALQQDEAKMTSGNAMRLILDLAHLMRKHLHTRRTFTPVSQFRTDVEGFVALEIVEACTGDYRDAAGRKQLLPSLHCSGPLHGTGLPLTRGLDRSHGPLLA